MTLASVRDLASAKRFATERGALTAEQMHTICLMLSFDSQADVTAFREHVSSLHVAPGAAR